MRCNYTAGWIVKETLSPQTYGRDLVLDVVDKLKQFIITDKARTKVGAMKDRGKATGDGGLSVPW